MSNSIHLGRITSEKVVSAFSPLAGLFLEIVHDSCDLISNSITESIRVQDAPEQKTWMNVDEAASYLNIKTSTLYNLSHKRRIASQKPGKRLLFKKEDLDEFIRSTRKADSSELDSRARAYVSRRQR